MTTPLPPASIVKRLFSTLYDILILTAVSLFYSACITAISTLAFHNTPENYQPNTNNALTLIGWVLTILSFYCFFWMRVGQTVAMKAWRLKLVSTVGKPLDIRTCVLRSVLGFIGFALGGFSYWWILFDKDKMALHDRLTNTRVVQLPKDKA